MFVRRAFNMKERDTAYTRGLSFSLFVREREKSTSINNSAFRRCCARSLARAYLWKLVTFCGFNSKT